jgi:hypothetical protein
MVMKATNPKPFVFVLMPFSDAFTDVYELGIKAACEDAGAYCERVDEQIFVGSILERVYNQIAKADIIVAEMTGRNPNVFYETGYAHALNKRVILLTQNTDDIPFDLKHYPHIVYGSKISVLKPQLSTRIKWCIENPQSSLSVADINLELSVGGIQLINDPEITAQYNKSSMTSAPNGKMMHRIGTRIDIHNISNTVLQPNSFSLALVTPRGLQFDGDIDSSSPLPDDRIIVNISSKNALFPDSWCSFALELFFDPGASKFPLQMLLRLFTEVGPKDYSFTLKLEGSA